MAKEEILEQICYTGGCNGDIRYREIYKVKNHTFKIEIGTDKSNTSNANLYVLNGLEWSLLYFIPQSIKKTQDDIKYSYRNTIPLAVKEFKADVEALKLMGDKILG